MLNKDETQMKPASEKTNRPAGHRHHRDQYVDYSHEMSHDTYEASGRVIVRIVPLLYSGMIGGIFDHMVAALSIGILVSVALDLTMGNKSLSRPILRPLMHFGCPLFAAVSRSIARAVYATGIYKPTQWRDLRCNNT